MSEHHLGEDLLPIAEESPSISAEHKAELEAHLRECAECKAAVSEARRVLALVAKVPVPEPGPAFARDLSARLDAIDAEARDAWWPKIQAFFTLPKLAGLGVAMAGALIATLILRAPDGGNVDGLELAEPLELAEGLELYEDLDVVENLDVLDDLEAIETLEVEPG
jgi:hypothetical protein